jgi:hypothetical protein
MIARCARCQGTFTTDRFGVQSCPHCGSELLLADPDAPAPAQPPQPPAASAPPSAPSAEPPAGGASAGAPSLPPPPPPRAGGHGPPAPGWGSPPGGGWGSYPPPAAPQGEWPAPFADRARRGFFAAFFETWKLVTTSPQRFFGSVRSDQTGSALLFGVLCYTVGFVGQALYYMVSLRQLDIESIPEQSRKFVQLLAQTSVSAVVVGALVLGPLLALFVTYVGAAVWHLLLMLFRGANRPFDATLTVVAYACAPMLLLVVPMCGTFVAEIWTLVVLVIGLAAIHRCGWKAAAAVLTPVLLACVCSCSTVALSFSVLMKAFQDALRSVQETRI